MKNMSGPAWVNNFIQLVVFQQFVVLSLELAFLFTFKNEGKAYGFIKWSKNGFSKHIIIIIIINIAIIVVIIIINDHLSKKA